jgi:5-methylcytosine-specific restriction endonuclease McrA
MSRQTPEYLERVNSPEWRVLKASLIRERGRRCERCGVTDKPLDLHHRHYDRLGREEPRDLQLLCRECHKIADRKRATDTAYYNGLATYTRKKYGEHADPADHQADFDQWREEKNR